MARNTGCAFKLPQWVCKGQAGWGIGTTTLVNILLMGGMTAHTPGKREEFRNISGYRI